MIFLISIIIILGLALIIWSISLLSASGAKPKKQTTFKPRQYAQDPPTIKPEVGNDASEVELEKAKATIMQLQNELETARKKELDFNLELSKQKDWNQKDQQELEKVKQENAQIKEGFIHKEKELEKEFALNLSLSKGLKESKEQLEALELEKKQLLSEIPLLKAQITGLEKEIARLNAVVAQNQKKEVQSEWISKSEYNELKKQLQEKEEALRKLQGGEERGEAI